MSFKKEIKSINLNLNQADKSKNLEKFVLNLSKEFSWIDFTIKYSDKNFIEYRGINFFGIPEGRILDLFLKLISDPDFKNIDNDKIWFEFFVSAMCPHCPLAFTVLIDILKVNFVKTDVYFIDTFSDRAEEKQIMSVPSLVINKNGNEIERFSGLFIKEDILKVVEGFDRDEYSVDYFINMLEQGRAEYIADICINGNKIFKGFKALFEHSKLSVRIGAIVAAEYLVEKSKDLFEQLLDSLFINFNNNDVSVKGDLLYLSLNSANTEKWIEKIQKIMESEEDTFVVESALESLKELKKEQKRL